MTVVTRTQRSLRLVSVAGTRPEAIKLAPLALAARFAPDLDHILVHTGQHGALFDDGLKAFGLTAEETLELVPAGLSIAELTTRILADLPALLKRLAPDIVIVQGDTTSALAAARVAHGLSIPLAHVEAGLRSGDPRLPWPEEHNRIQIDAIADFLFAPCEGAAANLRREGVRGRIVVSGNSGIDALLHVATNVPSPLATPEKRTLLVTCHRRESRGAPIPRICAALRALSRRGDLRIRVLLHPNPTGTAMREALANEAGIELIEPLGYCAMVAALKAATIVLSDSGGLQEECPALGIPLLVLRDNTERPEVIESGNALLVGTGTQAILDATTRLLDDPAAFEAMARPSFAYGRGDAAQRILRAIAQSSCARPRPEPPLQRAQAAIPCLSGPNPRKALA